METDRLEQHVFQLEKIRTQEIIQRFLRPSMSIADIGGATGVYSFWLHQMGHEVHLLDAAEFHIEMAKQRSTQQNKPLASITHGDARKLPYRSEQFDLVLLFGPFYHLQDKNDRIKCIEEARRVLKPGGVLLVAAISRYASLFDGFWQGFMDDSAFEKIMQQDLQDGNHSNPTDNMNYFTDAHFHTQQEMQEEFTAGGFNRFSTIAVEGFGWLVPGFMERWDEAEWRNKLLQYIRRTEADPAMTAISAHVITIAKNNSA
ncbi:MAG: class I SAM-dependent methyltransferase [Bacteroidia bacterium]|nr:class I SAM-dependent methyltransferase [Bacteroidia bacterium]